MYSGACLTWSSTQKKRKSPDDRGQAKENSGCWQRGTYQIKQDVSRCRVMCPVHEWGRNARERIRVPRRHVVEPPQGILAQDVVKRSERHRKNNEQGGKETDLEPVLAQRANGFAQVAKSLWILGVVCWDTQKETGGEICRRGRGKREREERDGGREGGRKEGGVERQTNVSAEACICRLVKAGFWPDETHRQIQFGTFVVLDYPREHWILAGRKKYSVAKHKRKQ